MAAGEITVYKLDANGDEVLHYPGQVVDVDVPNGICVRSVWQIDIKTAHFAWRAGDYSNEYFYTDRYYNIFATYDQDNGHLIGWYCNICRPAEITDNAVRCDDLALDLWVTPAGEATWLDVEEFEQLDLTVHEQASCLDAVGELKRLVEHGALPR